MSVANFMHTNTSTLQCAAIPCAKRYWQNMTSETLYVRLGMKKKRN